MMRTAWKSIGAICAAMVLGSVSHVQAAPVSYNFSITASEGSATGNFIGNDLDSSGSLSLAELLSFSVNATGTAHTGGPINISAANAVLSLFSFDLGTLALGFNASNGLSIGTPGALGVSCNLCAVGPIFLNVYRDGSGSGRLITAVSVTAVSVVPEPASLALVGLALTGIALSRRRKH
jgi:hypothetical protein